MSYKQVLSDLRKRGAKLIEYIHFPIEASFKRGFRQTGVYYGDDPYVLERYGKFPMNIYYKLYLKLLPPFLRDNPFTIASLVLTNSKWNAKLAKMVYGEEPVILNPPLPPNLDVAEKVKPFDLRDCAVVMVGRFSEEKRYHWVLQEVFPRLKKACSDAKLYIFGATGTRTAKAYYARLFELTKSVGFKASAALSVDADVYLVENAPRSLINDVMVGARVFLHATINEPWGMEPLTERAVQSSPAT
jgi:alpha-1,2-mannosyltransferase